MIVMIDNYDSFTYNLVQYLGELGAEVQVFRNDQISVDAVAALKPGLDALHALAAAFPAGTLSGAPKVRAMQIIDELEPVKRGIYGGAVGYLGWDGNMDTAIGIRTAVIKDGTLHVQAGGGVVADSVPELEWEETMNKARAMMKAAALAAGAQS